MTFRKGPSGELEDICVLVTRPPEQAVELTHAVEERGGRVVLLPVIRITDPDSWADCDRALRDADQFDGVIFTSANAVRRFYDRAASIGVDLVVVHSIPAYAVGKKTAGALESVGVKVGPHPPRFSSNELGRMITAGSVRGKRFLAPRGNIAMENLSETVLAAGATIEAVIVYNTIEADPAEVDKSVGLLSDHRVDVVTFTSPSAVRAFFHSKKMKSLFEGNRHPVIAAIGPTTSAALTRIGQKAEIVAGESTAGGLVESIVRYFHRNNKDQNAEE